jgi:hypothetical protein
MAMSSPAAPEIRPHSTRILVPAQIALATRSRYRAESQGPAEYPTLAGKSAGIGSSTLMLAVASERLYVLTRSRRAIIFPPNGSYPPNSIPIGSANIWFTVSSRLKHTELYVENLSAPVPCSVSQLLHRGRSSSVATPAKRSDRNRVNRGSCQLLDPVGKVIVGGI